MGVAPLLGLGALVLGGAAAAAGGGGGGGGGNNPPTEPVDRTPPAAPTISPTNGKLIKGTAEANAKINLDLDGNGSTDATVQVDASGNWTYTPATPIANGTKVTATATDAAGNTSGPTSVTVDAAAPPVPAIGSVTDDVAPVTGAVANGGATNDTRPTLSGTGSEAGATITIYDNGTQIGTTTADANGAWSFTPATALGQGAHSFTATATDALGNVSAPSPAYAVTVDTATPAVPAIGAVTDDVGAVMGAVANGGSTDDTRPTISGSGVEAGATISVFDNGTLLGTATAGANGDWSFTPATALGQGGHSFTATATDGAGNASAPSAAHAVTIDTAAPTAPTIGAVTDDVAPVTGPVANGGSTNDTRPAISGTGAEANATISVYDNGTLLGTTSADANGAWSFTPATALGQGAHSFTVTATDGAGNASAPSAAHMVTIDTAPPTTPVINPTDGGAVTGTAEPGATINLDTDGNGTPDVTVPVDESGNWSYTPPTPIPDGTTITATATDPAGNSSGPATVTVDDDAAPAAPVIAAVTDDIGAVTGVVANGGATDDSRPAISGTGAQGGATVSVYDNGTLLGTTTADGAGAWSFTPATALGQGGHSFTATATVDGDVSAPSSAYAVTVDTAAPGLLTIGAVTDDVGAVTGVVANGGVTDDTRPAISGSGAEANATISVYDNGALLGTATADAAGAWSFTPATALGQGAHSFTAIATDAAGNSSAPSAAYAVTIDTAAPGVPVIGSVTDDVGAVTGVVANGGTTDDNRPAIAGTGAEANATISVYDNGTLLGTTTANGAGAWSFTPASALGQGVHSFTVTATDAAGNVSGPSAAYAVTVDTAAPGVLTIASVTDDVGAVTGVVANGGVTDDTRPAIAGTGAEAGSTISVYDNGTLLGTTTADGSGGWSFTPTTALGQGAHSFTATETDTSGNISAPSAAYAVTIDTAAPGAPVIGSVTDDVGAITGVVANGGVTDDTRPAIAGSGVEANATISVYDNGVLIGTTTANGSGAWSFTPATALGQGAHSFTVTATDSAGNASAPSAAYAVTIDTAAPGVLTIGSVTDDVGAITGVVANGGTTDDTRPAIAGAGAEANATISIYDNGTLLGTTTANGSGAWSFTPATALGQGAHSFTATATDAAGNVSAPSAAYAVTVDTAVPGALVIGSVTDDVGPVTGIVANGGATDDTRPTIAGTGAEAGSTISVYDNGVLLGTATANGSGAWSFTPATALGQGGHSFTVTETDTIGNISPPSAAYAITIDTTAPALLTIGAVTDDVGAVTGVVANGGTTDDTLPAISGTGAEANATISVYDNGTLLGTTTANGSGVWSFTPASALGQGGHSFTVTATDAAGNVSGPSAAYAVTIDIAAPTVPVIGAVTDDVGAVTGIVANGGATDDTRPAISGTGAETNATISVYDNGTLLGTTSADGSGSWSFTPASALGQGGHSFTVTATDPAGNVSGPSAAYLVTIDTAAPGVPAIGAVTDDVGAITGTVANGGTTDDARPTVTGTGAEANATISVYDNGTLIGTTTANGAGAWSFTPATALGQGAHSFTATATDAAGNVSGPSAAYAVTIDTTAPGVPVIGSITDDVGTVTGTVANGGFTDDTRPAIAGTGVEANATVSIYDNGTLIGTTTANGAGGWSFTPATALGQGVHSFTVTATDAVGNVSAPSAAYAVTVDTVAPAAPVINPTNGGAVTGTAEPGTTLNLDVDGNGSFDVTVPVDASGNWTYTPPATIPDGTTVTATATDAAGNTSGPASTIVDDGAPPAAPVITSVTDDVAPVVGAIANGGSTNDTIPVIVGAGAVAGATISVYDNGVLLGTTTANAGGAWSFTPSSALGQGGHSFTATATVGGAASAPSAAYAVTIDTAAPGVPVIGSVTDDVGAVTGVVANGGTTDDNRPAIAGTGAEANATISIYDNGTLLGTTTANGAGAWSFTPASALGQGVHSFTVTATDAAGNVSGPSAAYAVTVDTAAPGVPAIGSVTDDVGAVTGVVANGGVTDDTRPAIAGSGAEANATISIYDNGVLLGTTTANGAGVWSFTPATALGQGGHSFTVTATDGAGNVSGPSAAYAVTIDTAAPGVPVIGSVTDDVGAITGVVANGGVTDDTRPAIAGSGVEANATISVYDNGVLIGTTTANGSGAWSFTPATALGQGAHSFTVTATDSAGNASAPSAAYAVTIDTAAPALPIIDSVVDDIGTVTGIVAKGGVTDDTRPAITGMGVEPGAIISVYDNGTLLGTTTANGAGAWSFTPATALGQGAHSFTVTATDGAGNVSGVSAPYALTIDTAAPTALTIASVTDDVGAITGVVANGGTTDDTRPAIAGTGAEANATISIYDNGTLLGTTTANGAGAWSFTPVTALGQGGHSFTVTATDAAGNVSAPSAAYAVTIDTAVPTVPAIGSVTDDVGAITGVVANGGTTDDTLPAIAGTGAEPNATISVYDNGTLLGTATANGSGAWSFTPASALGQGGHSFTVTATDAAGNVSAPSAAYAITIDTAAPGVPVIASVTDDVGLITGVVANGGVTDDTLPVIAGTGAEANATISVYDNGTLLGTTTANGSGAWSFTPASALGQGGHSFTVTATDSAGNASAPSAAYAITIDTAAPTVLTIATVTDDIGAITGVVADGGVTDDTRPAIAGTGAEANATISIYDNGVLLGTTTANGAGGWSFTPASALGQGGHSFTATATDAAGNVSAPSAAYAITIDTAAPAFPTIGSVTDDVGSVTGLVANGGVTDDTRPLIAGTGAEANATITVYDNGVALGTTTANGAGAWSFTPATALATGGHSFRVTATDAAGNVSPQSTAYTITIDTAAPGVPSIGSVTDDVGLITGTIANGGLTDDTRPAIAGTGAEANATISVYDNGTLLGTTTANGSGAWSFTPATALGNGAHSFTVTATDAAGNVSGPSAAYAITIDATAPAAPVITSVTDDIGAVTGLVANGGFTDDTRPAIAGTGAEANSVVSVYDNGTLLGTTTANGAGGWSFTPATALGQGAHSFTATSRDAAGNVSAPSAGYAVTIDTAAPTQTIAITALADDTGTIGDWSTEDRSPTIFGTLSQPLAASERVEIRIDGGAWVEATDNGTTWFYGYGTLSVGNHTIDARVVDAAGNVGTSDNQPIVITNTNQAPIVQANETALLGLISAETLGLIDINQQSLVAFDPDNNIKSVQIRYNPLINLNLEAYELTASELLATELGLKFTVKNEDGILGIIGPLSQLTITAIDGGTIDNRAINELLATVHFEQDLTLLGLQVLNETKITASDGTKSDSDFSGTLLDLSLLNANGNSNIQLGTTGGETLTGGDANERLYGFAGDDTLLGGKGNDLLRGGDGVDSLNGGEGNDVLVYDALDVKIDGGTGFDTLLIDKGTGTVLTLNGGATNIANIERIDLGVGDPGRGITLTEAGVIQVTDSDRDLYVTGDMGDTVTMTGAIYEGQILVNNHAYNQYGLGTTTIFVEASVAVIA
ncbi:Ig-like domain-containing protein [Sphingomonas colocasiae]|nr:Ig-like domain-containing protein [Sphingomonas colocasiae]